MSKRSRAIAAEAAEAEANNAAKDAGLPPDPDGRNDERAEWGGIIIEAQRAIPGADPDECLVDLLGNLMHWCDRNGQSFDDALATARMHYEAETEGG